MSGALDRPQGLYALAPAVQPMGQQDMLARLLRGNPDPSLPGYPVMQSAEDRGFAPMPRSFADAGARMAAVLRGDVEPTPEEGRQIATVRGFTEGPATIRAFHGSPHRFDRFDMSRIGTGEGAQAQGHGLYFASKEIDARPYRTELPKGNYKNTVDEAPVWQRAFTKNGDEYIAKSPEEIEAASRLWAEGGDYDAAIYAISKNFKNNPNEQTKIIDALKNMQQRELTSSGGMYEVNLNTTPDRLLDWDAPLSRQPQEVQNAFSEAAPDVMRYWQSVSGKGGDHGGFQYRILADDLGGSRVAAPQASQRLREAGIDGVQYLAPSSRAAGDGTRNYVMFDDKLIDILRRYGIAGTLGGGAAATSGTSE
jgi:hypothetical protein